MENGKAVGILQWERCDGLVRGADLKDLGECFGVEAQILPALSHKFCRAGRAGGGDQKPQRRMNGIAFHVVGFQQDVIPDHGDLAHSGILTAQLFRQKEKARAVYLHELLAQRGRNLRGDGQHGIPVVHQRRIAGERTDGIAAHKHGQRTFSRVPVGSVPDVGFQRCAEPGEIEVADRDAGIRNHCRGIRKAFKIPEFSHNGSFHFLALSSFLRTSSRPVR